MIELIAVTLILGACVLISGGFALAALMSDGGKLFSVPFGLIAAGLMALIVAFWVDYGGAAA